MAKEHQNNLPFEIRDVSRKGWVAEKRTRWRLKHTKFSWDEPSLQQRLVGQRTRYVRSRYFHNHLNTPSLLVFPGGAWRNKLSSDWRNQWLGNNVFKSCKIDAIRLSKNLRFGDNLYQKTLLRFTGNKTNIVCRKSRLLKKLWQNFAKPLARCAWLRPRLLVQRYAY